MNTNRRNLLVLGGIVATIYGLRAVPWTRFFGRAPDFVPIEGLSPFRTIETAGSVSSASAALIGIDPPYVDGGIRRARAEAVRANLCSALYNGQAQPGIVPIAYFSEFRCPYCRALERDLDAVLAANPGTVRLVQHELPIFGPPSELFARASVAAARQGLQQPFRRAFMATPLVADPGSVESVAAGVGIDTARLFRDMGSAEVQAELDRTRALADLFGFVGTPGLVIGRTVLSGAVDRHLIERIVEDERTQPPLAC